MKIRREVGENESSHSGAVNTETALTTPAAKDSDDMADLDSTSGRSPAFQFYPADFVSGTVTLTTEEVGAYMLLMCHCWDKGVIPSDVALLARIARQSTVKMRRIWAAIESKFQVVDGGYIQPRLERERQKQIAYRQRQADASRKRWESQATPKPPLRDIPNASSSVFSLHTSSSSSDFSQKKTGDVADARSKRPIFKGQRFVVFEWMLDDLARMLGSHADAFDLHAWFYELDEKAVAMNIVVPQRDGGKWLQERTQEEALRRGLPIAVASHNPKTAGNRAALAAFVAKGGQR